MKAAVLKAFGSPLVIEMAPDPQIGTGEVIVDVIACPVLNYSNEVLQGVRQYALELPIIPGAGAIGRVRQVGPDATKLVPGDWVFCDPTVRSRDDALMPDITLQGISARGDGGLQLQRHFHDGCWAEKVRVPTENAFKLPDLSKASAVKWCMIGAFLVPYGGLMALSLTAGETILINGATGGFGSAAVAVALAMGAGCVIATGRNERAFEELRHHYGPRIRTVKFSGSEAEDLAAMQKAAAGPIDCILDILPPLADPSLARAAIMAVRQNGRVALMGGIGMLGGGGLDLPYAWIMRNCITIHGQWMYPREVVTHMVAMLSANVISLDHYDVTTFALEQANEAVDHAAKNAGPFQKTVLCPQVF